MPFVRQKDIRRSSNTPALIINVSASKRTYTQAMRSYTFYASAAQTALGAGTGTLLKGIQ